MNNKSDCYGNNSQLHRSSGSIGSSNGINKNMQKSSPKGYTTYHSGNGHAVSKGSKETTGNKSKQTSSFPKIVPATNNTPSTADPGDGGNVGSDGFRQPIGPPPGLVRFKQKQGK